MLSARIWTSIASIFCNLSAKLANCLNFAKIARCVLNCSPAENTGSAGFIGASTDNAHQSAISANDHRGVEMCLPASTRGWQGAMHRVRSGSITQNPGDFLAGHHNAARVGVCGQLSFAGKWPAFEALVSSAALAIASFCVSSGHRRSHPDQRRSRVFRCVPPWS